MTSYLETQQSKRPTPRQTRAAGSGDAAALRGGVDQPRQGGRRTAAHAMDVIRSPPERREVRGGIGAREDGGATRFGLVGFGAPLWALKYALHIGDSSMR